MERRCRGEDERKVEVEESRRRGERGEESMRGEEKETRVGDERRRDERRSMQP